MDTEIMPEATTALAVRESTPAELMRAAIERGLSPETIGKLMDLQDRWNAAQAKKAYDEAMAAFQGKCPIIKKTKLVFSKKDPKNARYKYAPLDSIISQVGALLRECGFSYTVDSAVEDKWVTAFCKVTHTQGHSETKSFKVPIDADAYMSAPQMFASALTFAKRYAFCGALGILTGDEDNDAAPDAPPQAGPMRKPEAKPETKPETARIRFWHATAKIHGCKPGEKGTPQQGEKLRAWLANAGAIGEDVQLADLTEKHFESLLEQLPNML